MSKYYDIVADVTFYTDDKRNLHGKMIAGIETDNLISALKWFNSEVNEKAVIMNAFDYFVNPLYIGLNQNAISKKYYRDVVIKDNDLWERWCC